MHTHSSARRTTASLAAVALGGVALILGAGASSAADSQGGRPLTAALSGANEVGSGDPDGSGTARVTVNPGKNRVCWDITVANIGGATRGHIHEAGAGANGPIVATFFENSAKLQGCTTPTGTTAREILKDPAGYYVNIHNTAFPAGAIRGQLSK
ncbi:MAG: CHRD domain-containing protein [Nocardioides sp.]|nr:CHRD domain-containing protein [Nocardioides sp.]